MEEVTKQVYGPHDLCLVDIGFCKTALEERYWLLYNLIPLKAAFKWLVESKWVHDFYHETDTSFDKRYSISLITGSMCKSVNVETWMDIVETHWVSQPHPHLWSNHVHVLQFLCQQPYFNYESKKLDVLSTPCYVINETFHINCLSNGILKSVNQRFKMLFEYFIKQTVKSAPHATTRWRKWCKFLFDEFEHYKYWWDLPNLSFVSHQMKNLFHVFNKPSLQGTHIMIDLLLVSNCELPHNPEITLPFLQQVLSHIQTTTSVKANNNVIKSVCSDAILQMVFSAKDFDELDSVMFVVTTHFEHLNDIYTPAINPIFAYKYIFFYKIVLNKHIPKQIIWYLHQWTILGNKRPNITEFDDVTDIADCFCELYNTIRGVDSDDVLRFSNLFYGDKLKTPFELLFREGDLQLYVAEMLRNPHFTDFCFKHLYAFFHWEHFLKNTHPKAVAFCNKHRHESFNVLSVNNLSFDMSHNWLLQKWCLEHNCDASRNNRERTEAEECEAILKTSAKWMHRGNPGIALEFARDYCTLNTSNTRMKYLCVFRAVFTNECCMKTDLYKVKQIYTELSFYNDLKLVLKTKSSLCNNTEN